MSCVGSDGWLLRCLVLGQMAGCGNGSCCVRWLVVEMPRVVSDGWLLRCRVLGQMAGCGDGSCCVRWLVEEIVGHILHICICI